MTIKPTLTFLVCFLMLFSRLLAQSGGYDPSFTPGAFTLNGSTATINAVEALGDSILVGGDFDAVNGIPVTGLVKLDKNGVIDESFPIGGGPNGAVRDIQVTEDSTILLAGEFTSICGVLRGRVAVLSSDGSLDTYFNPGVGPNAPVNVIRQYDREKIIIGGEFTSVNGQSFNRVALLEYNGNLDPSFDAGDGFNGVVHAIAFNKDASYGDPIFIGGNFTEYDGETYNYLLALDRNGNADRNFNSQTGFNAPVYALYVNGDWWDSYLYVGGDFTVFEDNVRTRIARFDLDFSSGQVDPNFPVFLDDCVRVIRAGQDGRIFVAGDFTSINGFEKNRVARLLVDYDNNVEIDAAYNPQSGPDAPVHALAQLLDGRVVIGGDFSNVQGNEAGGLAKLYWNFGNALPGNATSMTITTASHSHLFLEWVTPSDTQSILVERSLDGVSNWQAVEPNGSPIVDGILSSGTQYYYRYSGVNYNGAGEYSLAFSGITDAEAWVGPGVKLASELDTNGRVYSVTKQDNGKIILGGDFSEVAGASCSHIARLNVDLSVDTTFSIGTGFNSTVRSIIVQQDGRILVGGSFSEYNGTTVPRIIRLNPDGSMDDSFDPGGGPNSTVYTIHENLDGSILMSGDFSSVDGQAKERFAKLSPNGDLDTNYLASVSSRVKQIIPQANGKVVIGGGHFDRVNGVEQRSIARLNADGTLDLTFNASPGADDISDIAVTPEGDFIICGSFSRYNNITKSRVAKIDSNGNLIESWELSHAPNSTVRSVIIDEEGRILIGGDFRELGATIQPRLARLDPNGTLDTTFQIGTGFNSSVDNLFLLDNETALVSGYFSQYNSSPVSDIALVYSGDIGFPYIYTLGPLPNPSSGLPYTFQFQAVGGIEPYSWGVSAGLLPSGLELATDGTLSGRPIQVANTSFTVEVQDDGGKINRRTFWVSVTDPSLIPIILEAEYGANGSFVDVASIISTELSAGNNTITASNSVMGGDPIFGVVKNLRVKYLYGLVVYEGNVNEGSYITLPDGEHTRLAMSWNVWSDLVFSLEELANHTVSGFDADPDGDGLRNIHEFAFGGMPLLQDSVDVSPRIEIISGEPVLGFWCDTSRYVSISVEVSNNLATNSWEEIASGSSVSAIEHTLDRSTVTDPAVGRRFITVHHLITPEQGAEFYRLKIQLD
jgi:uncharacterized delta-60 repeat protein